MPNDKNHMSNDKRHMAAHLPSIPMGEIGRDSAWERVVAKETLAMSQISRPSPADDSMFKKVSGTFETPLFRDLLSVPKSSRHVLFQRSASATASPEERGNRIAALTTKPGHSSFVIRHLKLLMILLVAGCSSAPDLEISRQFQDAEHVFSKATTPEEFLRAARLYDYIGRDSFVSGAVLYNQGNAWMRAGEVGRAIACYRQAGRYRPRNPYLSANLQYALSASGHAATVSSDSSIAGYVFFWQNWLSYPEKFTLTTLLLATALVFGLLSHVSAYRRGLRRAAHVLGVLYLFSVASTGRDWLEFDYTTHGVVISDEIVARKGDSDSYESAFTDRLTEGTEFTVLEQRNDWLHLQIVSVGTGWLPSRDVVVY